MTDTIQANPNQAQGRPLESYNQPPARPTPLPPQPAYTSEGDVNSPHPLAESFSQPVYNEDIPPARPTNNTRDHLTPFSHLDTTYLNRVQKDLRSIIPSDPTFLAHVGALLRALIAHELSHPDRIQADKEAHDLAAKNAIEKQKADLETRHEAEIAALPLGSKDSTPEQRKAAEELETKHQQELAALDHHVALQDLAARQAEERREFETRQKQQRDELAQKVVA